MAATRPGEREIAAEIHPSCRAQSERNRRADRPSTSASALHASSSASISVSSCSIIRILLNSLTRFVSSMSLSAWIAPRAFKVARTDAPRAALGEFRRWSGEQPSGPFPVFFRLPLDGLPPACAPNAPRSRQALQPNEQFQREIVAVKLLKGRTNRASIPNAESPWIGTADAFLSLIGDAALLEPRRQTPAPNQATQAPATRRDLRS